MFASVDSRSSRILRAYARVDGESIPIDLPRSLADRASKFRAQPDQATLQQLANELATMTWYDREQVRAIEKQTRLKEQGIDAQSVQTDPEGSDGKKRLRPVTVGDPPPPEVSLVQLEEIRLELWRRSFDEPSVTVSRSMALQANAPVRLPTKPKRGAS